MNKGGRQKVFNVHKYLRDIPVSSLMIIGLAISFFIVINAADITSKIVDEQKSTNDYDYNIDCMIKSPSTDEFNNKDNAIIYDIITYLEQLECEYVSTSDIIIYVNQNLSNYTCDIIFGNQKDLKMYNVEGEDLPYDKQNINSGNCAYLGETIAKDFLIQTNTKDFIIGKCNYNTLDTLENHMSGGIDNSIYIIWDYCTQEQKEILATAMYEKLSGFFRIYLKSDSPLDSDYDMLVKDMLQKFNFEILLFDALYSGDYQNAWYQVYSSAFTIISFVFSVLSCFVISDMWVSRRKKEIAIRKAFGFNTYQLFRLLFKDIFKLSAPSFILAMVIQLLYKIFFHETFSFGIVFWLKALIIISGMFIVIFLIIERILNRIKRISPIEWIRRST